LVEVMNARAECNVDGEHVFLTVSVCS